MPDSQPRRLDLEACFARILVAQLIRDFDAFQEVMKTRDQRTFATQADIKRLDDLIYMYQFLKISAELDEK